MKQWEGGSRAESEESPLERVTAADDERLFSQNNLTRLPTLISPED
jgi:hypothetical protein